MHILSNDTERFSDFSSEINENNLYNKTSKISF